MDLRFHWMLPKGGEMANQETARVMTTSSASLAVRPDTDSWIRFAQHAEASAIGIGTAFLRELRT